MNLAQSNDIKKVYGYDVVYKNYTLQKLVYWYAWLQMIENSDIFIEFERWSLKFVYDQQQTQQTNDKNSTNIVQQALRTEKISI